MHIGNASHRIVSPPEDYLYDLYVTKPYEYTRKAEQIPHTTTMLRCHQMKQVLRERAAERKKAAQAANGNIRPGISAPASGSFRRDADADAVALKEAVAADEASKSQ